MVDLLSPLNNDQITALENRLAPSRSMVGGTHGPPGTGKTVVAANEAVDAAVRLNERVLVCSFQNSTVDQTLRCAMYLLKLRFNYGDEDVKRVVKRTGNLARVAPDIAEYYSRNVNDLAAARIVGTTLHSSFVETGHIRLMPQSFNRIIMDESGQVAIAQAWRAIKVWNLSGVITLYGDDLQLPPISPQSIPENGVLRYLRTGNANSVRMLSTTYRLNSPGMDMTSRIFYFGGLNAPDHVRNRRISLNIEPDGHLREAIRSENTLVYVRTRGDEVEAGLSSLDDESVIQSSNVTDYEIEDGLAYDNPMQAMVICDICSELLRCGVPRYSISVIAPYRPHVRTINMLLEDTGIVCTTVHKMLGNENDVVIFATTRSNPHRKLGFVKQPQFLNVATSRQKSKLVIVGDNRETFSEGSVTSRRIYDFIASKGILV